MTSTSKTRSGINSAAIFGGSACLSFGVNVVAGLVMGTLAGSLGPIVVLIANCLLAIIFAKRRQYAVAAGIIVGFLATLIVAVAIIINVLSGLRGMGGP